MTNVFIVCFSFSMCTAAEVVSVVYVLNAFIWNRLFRWRNSVMCVLLFCVYAVFVIASVDYLSVILPILKLTSSNVFRFRQCTMLTFLYHKDCEIFQFICCWEISSNSFYQCLFLLIQGLVSLTLEHYLSNTRDYHQCSKIKALKPLS